MVGESGTEASGPTPAGATGERQASGKGPGPQVQGVQAEERALVGNLGGRGSGRPAHPAQSHVLLLTQAAIGGGRAPSRVPEAVGPDGGRFAAA